jgi:WhiB family redox-sensing transcriptional regulator
MPSVTVGFPSWRKSAACRSANPDLFFPVSSTGRSLEQVARAKAVCAACIVRRQCLQYALAANETHGVWGGMTEEERRRLGSRVRRIRQAVRSGSLAGVKPFASDPGADLARTSEPSRLD